jgi:hypothetical protein
MSRCTNLLLLLPLLALGCSHTDEPGDDDTDDVDDTEVPDEAGVQLAGTWAAGAGDAIFASRGAGVVSFLTFTDEGEHRGAGRLALYGRADDTHELSCPEQLWTLAPGGTLVLSGQWGWGGTSMYLLDVVDDDTITIRDAAGHAQTFTRADAVAAEALCGTVTVDADATFEVQADGHGNLLWDGTQLLVSAADGSVVPLDVDAGSTGASLSYGTSYEHLLAMQGTDGWGDCACGNVDDLARTSVGGAQVDLVDTTDLGHAISIDAAAFGGSTLWIGGYSYDDRLEHLLYVDASGEPDSVVFDIVTPLVSDAIAVHGTLLLGLRGNRIVEIDSNGLAPTTWQLPAELSDVYWSALTSDGTNVYVGAADGGSLRVVRLTLD